MEPAIAVMDGVKEISPKKWSLTFSSDRKSPKILSCIEQQFLKNYSIERYRGRVNKENLFILYFDAISEEGVRVLLRANSKFGMNLDIPRIDRYLI